jgi:hypothetical protein
VSWQLQVNAEKCEVLKLGRRSADSEYFMGVTALRNVTSVKDLGVHVSNSLNFREHISGIVSRAASKTGMVYRALTSRDKNFMVSMFVIHVRPVLEYCTEIWSPCLLCDIDLIENVQRKFTKRIRGMERGVSYMDRLQICGLELLELRRLKKDLIMIFKIIHNVIDLNFNDFLFTRQKLELGVIISRSIQNVHV